MTSPTNQQGDQQGGLPRTVPLRQTVVEDIDQYLTDGLPVFDMNSEKVGKVKMYSTAAGYVMVGTGALEHKDLYIPFRLIRSIDPDDIFVAETKDRLVAKYTQPPTISTVVEQRVVPGPLGTMTQQTREVQRVQSGYDDQPTTVSSVDVAKIADRLAVGMVVYDVSGERLGDVTEYNTARSLLVVEKGIFKPRVLFVPFSAIQNVDPNFLSVYLSLPIDVLVKQHAMLPAQG
jgi:ribosomal 30S subunit maturation factor RimM